jgi:SpoVK/Ycf46/Vps4 family AAA+-type ATPase
VADGGTTARVFGTFLTWLSEKNAPVFVVATANDVSQLPPELLRKGRLDEIFFVDLPEVAEREEIFRIHLAKRGRQPAAFDTAACAAASPDLSGAEIEEAINSALYDAFTPACEVTTAHMSWPRWRKPCRWPKRWTNRSAACAIGPMAAPATPAWRGSVAGRA